jgi:hypothetical protein
MLALTVIGVVVAVWTLVSIVLALLIGRAARIGEVKHQDAVFLRDVSAGRAPVSVR